MDRCSAIAGEHNGVKQLLAAATYHFVYIHCQNHWLTLCFAHVNLIPKFPDFENFESLSSIAKQVNPTILPGCYYSQVKELFNISSKSEGARFKMWSDKVFDMEIFKTQKLFCSNLI